MEDTITIRRSTERDTNALARLAALDSHRTPEGDTLLAFVGDELRAALDLRSGSAVADPFAHTSDVVDLLRARAGVTGRRERSHGLGRITQPFRKVRLA